MERKSGHKHAHFVILAEFDIGLGSVIREQVPRATGVSDTFLAEAMLPEGSHSRTEDETVFMLPLGKSQDSSNGSESKKAASTSLHCISCLLAKKDESVKRGSITKAIAVCSPYTFLHAFRPVIRMALMALLEDSSNGRDRQVVTELYESINGMKFNGKEELIALSSLQEALVRSARLREPHMRPVKDVKIEINWRNQLVESTVPPVVGEDEIGEVSVLSLVQTFPEGFMQIFNAVLLEKRVVFIGHNLGAKEVCSSVLGACLLISPPLIGVKRRIFPYTSLTNLETLLKTKGYIAGVTNPIFSQRSQWWDICCNLNTGKVELSESYGKELSAPAEVMGTTDTDSPSKGKASEASSGSGGAMDSAMGGFSLVDKYDSEFAAEVRMGMRIGRGETWVREMFTGYVQNVVDMAFGDAGVSQKEASALSANQTRIRMLKDTQQFHRHAESRGVQKSSGPCGSDTAIIARHVRTLQHGVTSSKELYGILNFLLKTLDTKEKLIQLLTFLPEAKGGLYPIAVCLFHRKKAIQDKALELLRKFDDFAEGSLWLSSLNFFLLRTYMRTKLRKMEAEKKKAQQEVTKADTSSEDRSLKEGQERDKNT